MSSPPAQEVTRLLMDWRNGDQAARDQLLTVIYAELREQAARCLRRERPDHTLQPTALVNEACLRLIAQTQVNWQNRAHFFGAAARLMRRILVDHARAHLAVRRGSGEDDLPLDEAIGLSDQRSADLIALDDALQELARLDERQYQVVELRYFGGLSIEETAEVLGISPATVKREWNTAKVWLHRQISKQ